MRNLLILALSALLLSACSSTGGAYASLDEPHGMLNFNAPRVQVMPVRLAALDGKNNLDPQRLTFPVAPGEHEVLVTAIDSTFAPTSLQAITGSVSNKTDPGKFTIEVKAGIMYWIAAEPVDDQGNWKPIIYNETYLDGPNKGKTVPDGQ